ncbi:uncharacterized protein CLUP02_00549 [Colletotrichum lupini]|uniref:Uncharacterized protein n=1 Tax=Colletotrichum lupini TaxID=145971 RepID=A0A9Q8SAK4_9PEZI|nr:uncharacterized protein CLUP02_00549 [Colletotrichum lupini]UQC73902.1 hypothetical protein CLUP02_00549 [Colletotrichum lupini]
MAVYPSTLLGSWLRVIELEISHRLLETSHLLRASDVQNHHRVTRSGQCNAIETRASFKIQCTIYVTHATRLQVPYKRFPALLRKGIVCIYRSFSKKQLLVSAGKQVEWLCPHCGKVVADSYIEKKPGGFRRLKSLLIRYSGVSLRQSEPISVTPEQNSKAQDASGTLIFNSIGGWFENGANVNPRQNLPQHHEVLSSNGKDPDLCKSSRKQVGRPSVFRHSFVLLCIPFMRWGTKADQPDVCDIRSDQNFFHLLRASYETYRAQSRWSCLRRVKVIGIFKFGLFRTQLVNISRSSFLSIGPDFDHETADTEPPIGVNLMMHLVENPDHADIFPVLFKRIPRKMRERLQPCPVKGSSDGWGMQFVETPNELYVFIVMFKEGLRLADLLSHSHYFAADYFTLTVPDLELYVWWLERRDNPNSGLNLFNNLPTIELATHEFDFRALS